MSDYSRRLHQHLIADLSPICCSGLDQTSDWMSVSEFSARTLLNNVFKKYVDREDPKAEARALDKFLQVNLACSKFELRDYDTKSEILIGEVKAFLYKFLLDDGCPNLTYGEILSRGRMGPGASILAQGNDFYTKMFSSRLSVTRIGLYDVFKRHIAGNSLWRRAEMLRSYSFGEPAIVSSNRLSFVPKTNETRRTICTEPSLNMYYQLGLGEWIATRLARKVGIDLSKQPDNNRELARIGSMNGQYFSLDLSSASDSLSLGMIRLLFPPDFVRWLEMFRSPSSILPDGRVVDLSMVSTMGNGFTFPLQTLLFTACVIACYRWHDIKFVLPSSFVGHGTTFGVFGDDILADRKIFDTLVSLLRLLGFTINGDKTFFEGPFRESCGGDYFNGHDVRAVYIRRLKTPQDRCIALNRLNEWSAKTGVRLTASVSFLCSTVPKRYVPLWEAPDAGIRVPRSMLDERVWSKHFQSLTYKRWVARPPHLSFTDVVHRPPGSKKRIYNPFGLEVSFLRGDIMSGRVAIRSNVKATRYSTKTSVAPNWDIPSPSVKTEDGKLSFDHTTGQGINPAGWLQSLRTAIMNNSSSHE